MVKNDMPKIYVPDDSYSCYVVNASGYIRAYESTPQHNTTSNYRDYYFTNNYYYNDGSTTWSTYSTLPVCLDSDVITTDVWFRYDFDKILTIFLILFIFLIFIPLHIINRIFPKERRVC